MALPSNISSCQHRTWDLSFLDSSQESMELGTDASRVGRIGAETVPNQTALDNRTKLESVENIEGNRHQGTCRMSRVSNNIYENQCTVLGLSNDPREATERKTDRSRANNHRNGNDTALTDFVVTTLHRKNDVGESFSSNIVASNVLSERVLHGVVPLCRSPINLSQSTLPDRTLCGCSTGSSGDNRPGASQSIDEYSRLLEVAPPPSWDLVIPTKVYDRLHQCGFYYGRMTTEDAEARLHGTPVGMFLLRNSSDPHFVFSLSIQTNRGTTSTRISFDAGQFRLNHAPEHRDEMPAFDCVLGLIEYYLKLAGRTGGGATSHHRCIFAETNGRKDTPVVLTDPLLARPAELKHLCRKTVNRSLAGNSVERLYLTPSLKAYLNAYPYVI